MKKTVKKCIYCGKSDGKLTDEHVVPSGLLVSGQEGMVLEKASCATCQKIINKVETDVLKVLLKQPRSVLGFKSKHKTHQKKHMARMDGNEVEVKMGEVGAWISLPEFEQPHLGNKKQTGINIVGNTLIVYNHEKFTEKMKKKKLSSVGLTFNFKPAFFARFIAKMAYGFFVYQYGLDKLKESYLPKIILGKNDDIGSRVGNIQVKKLDERTIVRIDIQIKSENRSAICYIRLFEPWGGLTYVVHVGIAH